MNSWAKQILVVLMMTAAGCGGGGGKKKASGPAPVTVAADIVTLSGQAGWPGATTVSVTIDGNEVPLTDGVWTHSLDLRGADERMVRVAVIADGATVALRDVVVRR